MDSKNRVGSWFTFCVGFLSILCANTWAADPKIPIAISSITELQGIGVEPGYPFDGSYYLTQDIDASATAGWNDGAGFAPIETLAGTFDGAGRVISHLYINRPGESNVGLFAQLATTGAIQNLAITNSAVTGGNQCGPFVGFSVGVISRCYSTASVTANVYAGGIAGVNGGTVQQCFFTGEIPSATVAGGIAGLFDGIIQECYAAGPIQAPIAGGLAGYDVPDDPPKAVKASTVSASFWDIDVCGTATSAAGGTGLHTAAMKQAASFTAASWDFVSNWDIVENLSYPWLRILPNPHKLHTADQNGDHQIILSELLRVIQFFNSGGYHCAEPPESTEDGYAPGPDSAHQACTPHTSDYNLQDWLINLSELLRVIQFFNSGGYHACPGEATEDGFCVGLP